MVCEQGSGRAKQLDVVMTGSGLRLTCTTHSHHKQTLVPQILRNEREERLRMGQGHDAVAHAVDERDGAADVLDLRRSGDGRNTMSTVS